MNGQLWQPSAAQIERSNLYQFMQQAGERAGKNFATYDDLYQWSIEQPEAFWTLVWDFGGVRASRRGERVLVDADRMPGARWFPEARAGSRRRS